jgi:hypothetical protein
MSSADVILSLWLLVGGGFFLWVSVAPIPHGSGE